jgi:biopolymer transport protein TolR
MAFSASNSTQQSEINVTPLIDVLLVLLIIFMVIVPVTPRGLESRVPDRSKAPDRTQAAVSLRVVGDEAVGRPVSYEVDGKAVDLTGLNTLLLASLSLHSQRAVYVTASPTVSYREVATAVAAARSAGATTVALGRL